MNILIVDDDPTMLKTLKDIFGLDKYTVETALSGIEALEKFNKSEFSCVLIDIKMPGMNGVELFQEIKKKQPQIPVILMTAYATDRLVLEGMREGALVTLTKPLDIDNLKKHIAVLVIN